MKLCSKVPAIHIFAVILGSLEIVLFGGVIFGWHSVVYIYKDTGYFSNHCPGPEAHLDTVIDNITWNHHTPSPGHATFTSPQASLNPNDTISSSSSSSSINTADSTPRIATTAGSNSSVTTPVYYETGNLNDDQNSVHFDRLSCEEQIRVRSKEGVSQTCKPQDEQFNLVFSLATGVNGILSFPSGILYDRLGTRISRIISIVSFLMGQFCLIFASPSNPYLLYPGFIGLVYGGYQILLTNLQLSCLIPSLRSTIMSLYSGSYDTSSSVFLLFKTAHEAGVSINTSFAVHLTLYCTIFISSTFLLLPKGRIPFPLFPGFQLRCSVCEKFCGCKCSAADKSYGDGSEWRMDPNGSIILSRQLATSTDSLEAERDASAGCLEAEKDATEMPLASVVDTREEDENGDCWVIDYSRKISEVDDVDSASPRDAKNALKEAEGGSDPSAPEGESMLQRKLTDEGKKTFRLVALSPLFLTDLLWISFQRLRSWIFVGMFNPWITRMACGDKALVSHYTSVYAGLQFFGILTAPLSGRLMDRKIKGAEKYSHPRYERLHASIASFVLNSSVSVLLTICTMIPVLKLQYLSFVLHCLHRSFLYGPNSAFVANGFPHEHFGKLFGVTLTVSALFSMLQYPLFLIMQGPLGGDPLAINVLLLVLMLISYIHPIYIWHYLQKKVATDAA